MGEEEPKVPITEKPSQDEKTHEVVIDLSNYVQRDGLSGRSPIRTRGRRP